MKSVLVSIIFALMVLSSPARADEFLYVINGLAQTLSKINLATSQVENHILTLGVAPNDIKIWGDSAYVLNSTSDNIQIFDLINQNEVGTIEFAQGGNPWEMAFAGNGSLWVTNYVSGRLYEIDIPSRSILRNIPVGNTLEGLLIHGSRIFVTDVNYNPDNFSFGEGKLYYSDLPELNGWSSMTIGTNPQRMLIGPDGYLHIICTGNYSDTFGAIYIIEPMSVSIVDSINIGGSPGYGVATESKLIFLGAGGWIDDGEVYCYDSDTYEILNGPSNPIQTGAGAGGMATDIAGNAYSCNFMDGSVSKISPSRQVVETYLVGDGPQVAAYYNPDATGLDDSPPSVGYELSLKLYPNPFNNFLSIQFQGNEEKDKFDICIFDLRGNLVRWLCEISVDNHLSFKLDCSNFASGVYFLEASDGENKSLAKFTLIK